MVLYRMLVSRVRVTSTACTLFKVTWCVWMVALGSTSTGRDKDTAKG